MYRNYLSKISALTKKYGGTMQAPASAVQLEKFVGDAKSRLRVSIPIEYIDFLQVNNGLDWNGVSIYATEAMPIQGYSDRRIMGCVEANLARREVPNWKRFLVIGESGEEDYCLDLMAPQYVVVDSASTDVLEVLPSFGHLITRVLQSRI